jgi:lipoate-protein ligase A
VLQGPGCLCYGITLDPGSAPALESIDSTNRWILESQVSALQPLMETQISIEGHTDLALTLPQGKRKFSGNAQRRTRGAILFHGTFLYGLDIRRMSDLLKLPVDRPAYRDSRDHHDFLTRIPMPPDRIRMAIRKVWGAIVSDRQLPDARHQQAMALRYGHAAWHWSRSEVRDSAPVGAATRSHAF